MAESYNKEKEEAIQLWDQVKKEGNALEIFQADFNLEAAYGHITKPKVSYPNIPATLEFVDDFILQYLDQFTSDKVITLSENSNIKVEMKQLEHSIAYLYQKNGADYFVLQQINETKLKGTAGHQASSIFTAVGGIINNEEEDILYLVNAQGKILEWAKYFDLYE